MPSYSNRQASNFDCPVKGTSVIGEVNPSKAMDDVTASDDEDAFAAQVFQFLAGREVEFRLLDQVEIELQLRDIRCRTAQLVGCSLSTRRLWFESDSRSQINSLQAKARQHFTRTSPPVWPVARGQCVFPQPLALPNNMQRPARL